MIRAMWLATLVAGCLPLPPEHPYEDERALTVEFSIRGPNDAAATCPAGFDTIQLDACLDDTASQCFPTRVPCEGSGTITTKLYTKGHTDSDDEGFGSWDLTPNYVLFVSITDSTGEDKRATSLPTYVEMTSDRSVDMAVYPDAGFVKFEWELRSGITGNYVATCGAVGVDEIEVAYRVATPDGAPEAPAMTKRWPCDNRVGTEEEPDFVGDGLTPAIATGEYFYDLRALRGGVEVGLIDDYSFSIGTANDVDIVSQTFDIMDR